MYKEYEKKDCPFFQANGTSGGTCKIQTDREGDNWHCGFTVSCGCEIYPIIEKLKLAEKTLEDLHFKGRLADFQKFKVNQTTHDFIHFVRDESLKVLQEIRKVD